MMKITRLMSTVSALLFMALFLGALGLRLWASSKSTEVNGPDHIAAGPERVYVHANGELLVLSASGKLLARQAIASLGVNDAPIDLGVLQDGRVLVAGQ